MGTALISPQSTQSKYTKAQIGNKTYKLEVAKTLEEKAKGLSGRKSLAKDQGMIFVFETTNYHSFWMKDMHFPLDFIWIKGNKVVDLTENVMLQAEAFTGRRPHDKIIELNAGEIKKSQIQIGDSVYLIN
ncbi:MAG: DUF192 domain-containing protein [bacterium]